MSGFFQEDFVLLEGRIASNSPSVSLLFEQSAEASGWLPLNQVAARAFRRDGDLVVCTKSSAEVAGLAPTRDARGKLISKICQLKGQCARLAESGEDEKSRRVLMEIKKLSELRDFLPHEDKP